MTVSNEALLKSSSTVSGVDRVSYTNFCSIVSDDRMKLILLAIIGVSLSQLIYHAFITASLILVVFIVLFQIGLKLVKRKGEWENVIGTEYRFLFGDLPDIQACKDGLFLKRLKASLGYPKVYRIWMGPQPTLVLAHPEAVRQFWQNHDEKDIHREVKLGWPITLLMSEAIGLKTYRERNRMAKFFHACFGPNRVAQFDAVMEFETDKVINRLSELTVLNHIVDISPELKYLTLYVCADFFLGPKWSQYRDKLRELNDNMFNYMWLTYNATWINLPLVQWLLPKSLKLRSDILKFRFDLDSIIHKLMDEYKVELQTMDTIENEKEGDSMLVRFIKMQPEDKFTVTYLELFGTIIEGLMFPTDATASTFIYTLILLSWNKHAQTEARQLILNQLEQIGKSANDAITLSDIRSIQYLDWILSECQRLLPIFMFNVPEYTSQSMTICGVSVPKNTMATYDVQSLNCSDDVWDEPLVFRPERFQSLTDKQHKAIHSFGNGRSRRCLGEHVIKMLHKLLIARILLRFRVEAIDDNRDIDQIPRQIGPFFIAPNIQLRLIPI